MPGYIWAKADTGWLSLTGVADDAKGRGSQVGHMNSREESRINYNQNSTVYSAPLRAQLPFRDPRFMGKQAQGS